MLLVNGCWIPVSLNSELGTLNTKLFYGDNRIIKKSTED